MLRFAVHQLGQRRASSRSHGTPCRDIPCRVQVSIGGIGAGDTAEESLALATLRSNVSARRTTLAGEGGIDWLYSFHSLVFRPSREYRPSGVVDGSIETCLLLDVAPGTVDGALRRADHIRHPEILDPDRVVLAGDGSGRLLHEVLAPVGRTSMELRQPSFRASASIGAEPTPAERTSRFPGVQRLGRLVAGAVGQRESDGDATVDTHDRAVAGTVQRSRDDRECDMPTPGRIQLHAVGIPFGQRSGTPESFPANLRYQDPGPTAADLFHPQGSWTDDAETFVSTPLAPCWPSMAATPPVRHSLREIPQRLLLHRVRARTQPLGCGTSIGQLPTLRHIVRDMLSMMPIPQLLYGEVPYEPSVVTRLREQHRLLGRRIHAKPHKPKLVVGSDSSRSLSVLTGGSSARDCR